jgi:hypothetical protein
VPSTSNMSARNIVRLTLASITHKLKSHLFFKPSDLADLFNSMYFI